ncbi:hypothetical protein G7054_g4650 [Neopestalotiopsis clavispora]|nr:hypothetical protein G7054_g4650 [Neopestalotiopsis clavispora]
MKRYAVNQRYIEKEALLALLQTKWPRINASLFNIKMRHDVLKYSAPEALSNDEAKSMAGESHSGTDKAVEAVRGGNVDHFESMKTEILISSCTRSERKRNKDKVFDLLYQDTINSNKMLQFEKQRLVPRHLVSDIFVDSDHSYIDVIESAGMTTSDPEKETEPMQTRRVANLEDLECELSSSSPANRVAVICQEYSWSPLQVSEEMFESFSTHVEAFDGLRNTVMSFRSKTTDLEQALTICTWKDHFPIHELSYVFKYAEMKTYGIKRTGWVIRQTGLYQRVNSKTDSTVWMVIFPNQDPYCQEIMSHMLELGPHPLYAHIAIFSRHLDNWRWYMADHEQEFRDLAKSVLNVEVEETLDFVDMYDQLSGLRYVQSRIAPLIPIFAGYHQIVARLAIMNEYYLADGHISKDSSHSFTASLEDITSKVQSFEVNAQFLLERVANTIQMASDTIGLKSQNNTEDMSNNMLKDSLAMRIITLVTLVFLPGTFVSGFFGMGFFTIDSDDGGKWVISPQLWVYFAAAVPVTALTLAYWRWRNRRAKAKRFSSSPV